MKKFIKLFEDNDYTFDLLSDNVYSFFPIPKFPMMNKIEPYKISIEVNDIDYIDLIAALEILDIGTQVLKYSKNNILRLFFRRITKEIFEYRNILTDKISLIDIVNVKNIIDTM